MGDFAIFVTFWEAHLSVLAYFGVMGALGSDVVRD